ncbi:glycosyltransferase family 90 protein [Bipolaris oryzae ATCC 44560]|uniref:Glycosyltransferase family 90 protein n=1 Tax=Bipolaris oryzae ATCC 44560 TaxID=930090 RepID=W6ZGF5_COCMI|nr:glycosyltransferase family 90 protein [Bipolaris oryzae ATCC 44560]EUC46589.1 glycosyltransferase family 90 protein [Bipolaris oryzae ATCC 44560]
MVDVLWIKTMRIDMRATHAVLKILFEAYLKHVRQEIDGLIRSAEMKMADMLSRQTHTFEAAVDAYRSRRNQDPSKGFRQWYDLARNTSTIVIEDMWDPIYEDLEVYAQATFPAGRSRASALRDAADYISVPNICPQVKGFFLRKVKSEFKDAAMFVDSNCEADNRPCLEVQAMLNRVAQFLPSMSIPVNDHASPRVIVPHGDRSTTAKQQERYAEPFYHDETTFPVLFNRAQLAIDACSPTSPLGNLSLSSGSHNMFEGSYGAIQPKTPSLVSNGASWRDVCHQPWLLDIHGALIRPNALSTSQRLLPLFSSAKLSGVEVALRFPDTIYWSRDPDYNVNATDVITESFDMKQQWLKKLPVAYWRGTNTGGGHDRDNWHRFHRHRFVASTNATWLRTVQSQPRKDWTRLSYTVTDRIISLAEEHTDVGFTSIVCRDDGYQSSNKNCSYLGSHFVEASYMPLSEILSRYRFLYDVDGNSYSGRFYALLSSNSVVLKATVFQEWHDARLLPWLHFIPISNHFGQDLWDVLEYFLKNEELGAKIAGGARRWADMVLRPVDLEIYLLRLLLEWARFIGI